MVPVDYSYQSKKKYQEPFFYLSSNSIASFLSQTSNLVHHSLHLSTWSPRSPRFTSHDLYLCCWSLASRAKRSFYFGPLMINGSNSKLSLFWLHNFPPKNGKELWRYKHRCFILSSSLLSFNFLLIIAHYYYYWSLLYSAILRSRADSLRSHMKECIYYLLTQTKAAHKTKHISRPVFSCCVHIPSHSFQFCHSCHQ